MKKHEKCIHIYTTVVAFVYVLLPSVECVVCLPGVAKQVCVPRAPLAEHRGQVAGLTLQIRGPRGVWGGTQSGQIPLSVIHDNVAK